VLGQDKKGIAVIGVVSALVTRCYQQDSCWIPRWLPRKPLRAKTGTKWRQGRQAFVMLLVLLWTFAGPCEESVLFSKSSF
jgi:hypothetical protein